MQSLKTPRELTAPDLVKEWKKIVNQNVMMGRDAHMIKKRLEYMSPVQILHGMYQYKDQKTISIPQFLDQEDEWYVENETEAAIELAICISHTSPPAYWIWQDYRHEQDYYSYQSATKALKELQEWSNRILGD